MTTQRNKPAILLLFTVLATGAMLGCSGAQIGDRLSPSIGGLPQDTPARPAGPSAYPAVHDVPPPRQDTMLDEDEQAKLQRDLLKARDRQTTPEQRAAPTKSLKKNAADKGAGAPSTGANRVP